MTPALVGGLLAGCPIATNGQPPTKVIIERAATRFGIPADWIASVMQVESGGQACRDGRSIVSSAGAIGLMQVMKPTWNELDRLFGLGTSIYDPEANVNSGAAYLRLMYDRFGYPGVFAAYNAGPRRYEQSLSGRPLPNDTRRYVNAVLSQLANARVTPKLSKSACVFEAIFIETSLKDQRSTDVCGQSDIVKNSPIFFELDNNYQ